MNALLKDAPSNTDVNTVSRKTLSLSFSSTAPTATSGQSGYAKTTPKRSFILQRYYCDHCHKELYYPDNVHTFESDDFDFDLCEDCKQLLIDWVRNVK